MSEPRSGVPGRLHSPAENNPTPEEAANLARGKILQEAGAAVPSQVNQQPKLALLLLQTK